MRCIVALSFVGILLAGCRTPVQPETTIPVHVILSPKSATIQAGGTLSLIAHVENAGADSLVMWEIVNAKGDGTSGSYMGLSSVTAAYRAPASVVDSVRITLRARAQRDTSQYADCIVTVIPKPLEKARVTIAPLSVSLVCGMTQQFSVTVTGGNAEHVLWRVLPDNAGTVTQLDSTGITARYETPESISSNSMTATIEAYLASDSTIIARSSITLQAPPPPCFRTEIHPMFVSNCSITGCHNPADRTADIDFTSYEGVLATLVPGDTSKGLLYHRITHVQNPLTKAQIARIGAWIMAGAPNSQCEAPLPPYDTSNVHYSDFVQPTLQNYCIGCHSGKNAVISTLDLTTFKAVNYIATTGKLASVIRGQSYTPMPLYGAPLDSCTVAKILAWINRGAPND